MITFSFFYQIFIFLIISIGFLVSFLVYFVNRKNRINQFFFLFTVAMLSYLFFSYLSHHPSQITVAIIWKKLFLSAIALFLIFTYFFSVYFPKKEKTYPIIEKIILITELLFIPVIIFTGFFINGVKTEEWGNNIVWGIGKNMWFGAMIIFTFIIVGQIFKKYFTLSKAEKLQAQYFLIGIFIFTSMNFIFNMIFPIFKDTFKYYYLGDLSAFIFLTLTAYAIIKRELFGIRVILTIIFVAIIGILLGLQVLVFTTQIELQLLNLLILVVFLYFGYLLIRSVLKEIEQRKEIERLSNAKSEFIAIASHQLRTPLTAVKGYISMILEGSYGKIPEKAKAPMEKVYQQNEKLVKLVNDLLSLSRLESGKLQLELGLASMEDLIFSIVDIFAIQAKDKNLYLKFEKPKEQIPLIIMDADKNRQVISNIINNCLKYTEKGGVTIKLRTVNGKLQVEVSDTGLGMDEKELGKLFQSFSRGEAGARMDAGGAGLGLYIAKKFIEMQKGKIWAESAGKDKGSQFYIELPINNHNNH